jgi:S1-C subfamily serine protease
MPGLPTLGVLLLVGPLLASVPSSVWGEGLPDVFQRVTGSVVVVRAKGRDLVQQGANSVLVKFNEVGSGVLASADGKVLTAAHVVQIADEMMVEFLGGEAVPARVVSSEPRSDLALLQLARVPAGVKPAQLGDSASTRVGEQVFIVGAPYGIAHSLTVG